MGAALAAVVNGGTYHRPHLVEKTIDGAGHEARKDSAVVSRNVVSPEVGKTIQDMMEYTITKNRFVYGFKQKYSAYGIGGKTGTAEVARPEGGYYDNVFNGMFMGFVGGNKPEYVIVVRVDKPKIPGYAGAQAAAPLFVDLTGMLINNFGVTPRM
jgi:cell division protein FtsI/penicillin-binding protein 2